MNTNQLKRFAQQARRKLIEQVGAKIEYVLNADSIALREQAKEIRELKEEIARTGKEQLIEKVAYTWFNRLMALRFMDANEYQPSGMRIISPKDGHTLPELLNEAKQVNIPGEFKVDKAKINDLLDGKIPSPNAQNEVFRLLLIAACNDLHVKFPFLFEAINDYTELLLPDDLTSEFSIVHDVVIDMCSDDCQQVEVIGWLYQFYISEKKDEVFASKSKVKKEDIPAATQLFTPRWIVEYMVQNTLGKLWLQNKPGSSLRKHMPYFIESPSVQAEDYLKINSVEEIKLLDQACGSGHILVYGFDLFTKIYEEEGYNPSEIPQLIISKNLFGFEIDERAAQLAGMALMMKARSYHRRVFSKNLEPNIICFRDFRLSEDEVKDTFTQIGLDLSDALKHDLGNMQQATNLGSLIVPHTPQSELEKVLQKVSDASRNSDVFLHYNLEQLERALTQLLPLSKKYHCIVDNPPYMGIGNVNKSLADFVKTAYPLSKADLMACFMETGLAMLYPKGFLGMINQHSWMFLSSYEKLRNQLLKDVQIDTLLHLGPRAFPEIGGEVVQNASFTFWNNLPKEQGVYFRLVDDGSSELKQSKTLEAIQNPDCGWAYTANQKDFEKIPGSPIGYWLSDVIFEHFDNKPLIENAMTTREGMATADNERFLRYWSEVNLSNVGFNTTTIKDSISSNRKWFPYNKGGIFRRWYGNNQHLVNWKNDGFEIRNNIDEKTGRIRSHNYNGDYAFKEGVSWTAISSASLCVRYSERGFLFDSKGAKGFSDKNLIFIHGLLNSKVAMEFLMVLAATLDYKVGDILRIPLIIQNTHDVNDLVTKNIYISKKDWDSTEKSWNLQQNELLRIKGADTSASLSTSIEESYDLFQQYWRNRFFQLHRNEEELNRQFIEIYGLQDELTPDVPLEDITILREELDQKALKKLSNKYKSGWKLENGDWRLENGDRRMENGDRRMENGDWGLGIEDTNQQSPTTNHQSPNLPFDAKEVFSQFVSYAVGCMFGRYSLDQEGLILANQGEALEDYLKIIASEAKQSPTFLPDDDNIIPVLDDEWFEDDITGRFREFLRVSFGEQSLEKNLAFVETCLGTDIRKYFNRDFYKEHITRYKKRPIYWMFSSPKGYFNVLIYMHRYTRDTISNILNNYLREFIEKLKTRKAHWNQMKISGTGSEQTQAIKEMDKLDKMLLDCQEYERDILYPLASERIPIDLDDGVLVNYNKFGKAIKEVSGLNDKKAKDKVRGFDWIDTTKII